MQGGNSMQRREEACMRASGVGCALGDALMMLEANFAIKGGALRQELVCKPSHTLQGSCRVQVRKPGDQTRNSQHIPCTTRSNTVLGDYQSIIKQSCMHAGELHGAVCCYSETTSAGNQERLRLQKREMSVSEECSS